jgi:hypothetical protein
MTNTKKTPDNVIRHPEMKVRLPGWSWVANEWRFYAGLPFKEPAANQHPVALVK